MWKNSIRISSTHILSVLHNQQTLNECIYSASDVYIALNLICSLINQCFTDQNQCLDLICSKVFKGTLFFNYY